MVTMVREMIMVLSELILKNELFLEFKDTKITHYIF